MTNTKKTIFLLALILIFSTVLGCKEVSKKETSAKEKWNPELQNTISFVQQDYSTDDYKDGLYALQENGELIFLFRERIRSVTVSKNTVYLLCLVNDLYELGKIDLTQGDGNYSYQKITDFDSYYSCDMISVGNYLFYSHQDFAYPNLNSIGRYNLLTDENEPEFKKFGYHEISGLSKMGEDGFVYRERSGFKDIIKNYDVTTNQEETITEYGKILFTVGEKLIYANFQGKDKVAFYEYINTENHKHIANGTIMDFETSIIPYGQGYLYMSSFDLYYYDGLESRKLAGFNEKNEDRVDICMISQNEVRVFPGRWYNKIVYDYDLETGELTLIKVPDDENKPEKFIDHSSDTVYYLPFAGGEVKELTVRRDKVEEMTKFIGTLKPLEKNVNYRSKAKINNQTYLGKLKKNEIYNVYGYEICELFKRGGYFIEGWYIIDVKGKKVYVADISELLEYKDTTTN